MLVRFGGGFGIWAASASAGTTLALLLRGNVAHALQSGAPTGPHLDTLDPQTFKEGQAELARDMIVQAQRIEYLASELPGLQNSERDQLRIISGLEEEIAGLEAQRLEAVRERDEVFGQLDALLRSLQRP
ncbi:hypothetical protein CHGG_04802 [Chaetomium globosum CBS 148.51]|uniref:Mediator of RNA polymerase II transcription subunit 21 n=1 Tax=Chaetomium globosum (strain ATCC 6205 / CBS 148.51 / DSM 1962 / NBRC 6347 / NRRL 1970) TaxID=306901 RepID=Q2H094_CHAGB|nr:uncharacterized protein CHGG_04802 [Chaetomium globosum CBS 148.51]EAQ88183.1 hypothetical protein CHGG_04802 [Chaetomium globosum CBS 148.51]